MSGKGSEARLTHGGDPRFRELVRAMDREYGERFGAAALKCRSCHGLDDIRQACLLLRDGQVVGTKDWFDDMYGWRRAQRN